MDKDNKDLKKEIEDLEKLIEQVQNQQKEEMKKEIKKSKTSSSGVIKIDLGSRYSSNFLVHLFVSFLVNFLLLYALNSLFVFAEVKNDYFYLVIAASFTLFEELYKWLLLKYYVKFVLYSLGLIFYLLNISFFYFMDMVVFPVEFSFIDSLYPLGFVLIFQIIRIFFKSFYNSMVRAISQRLLKNKHRR